MIWVKTEQNDINAKTVKKFYLKLFLEGIGKIVPSTIYFSYIKESRYIYSSIYQIFDFLNDIYRKYVKLFQKPLLIQV